MHQSKNDDLFKESTMSFGEHLEELRRALFKAMIGLAIGAGVGLLVANQVVGVIQAPLSKSLVEYYSSNVGKRYAKAQEMLVAQGYEMPHTPEEVQASATPKGRPPMTFEVRLVAVDSLRAALGEPTAGATAGQAPAATDAAAATASTTAASAAPTPITMKPLLLWQPASMDSRVSITSLSVTEGFSIWLKAGLVFGVVISSPWIFYHLWNFVAAGLYPHERHYVHLFLPFSLGLFLMGAALAYFFVFSPVLEFLFRFNEELGLEPEPRISEWLSFVLLMPLGFGIAFQLPLVMLFLERIGVFNVTIYLEKWRIAVFIIFVLSAVLTPADPYSMLLMALPLTLLYVLGVGLCHYFPKSRNPYAGQ